ncbi:ecto-ADP-ribosyltransferase 5-like [Engystomops pustulosus]|uniref:ecto-ADP-ribosyltransferase 5-like n=1 Tax=Engystomops pustulosus TaxID=76066 RepID=UPI003AFAFC52
MSRGSSSPMAHPPLSILCLGLFIFVTRQAFCVKVQLEMFEDSFDDQYIGCTEKMESLAPKILKKERTMTLTFDKGWSLASTLWKKRKPSLGRLPGGFKEEYGIALLLYSIDNLPTRKDLNEDIRRYGTDPTSFRFYALHFYLTRALTLLQSRCDGKPRLVLASLGDVELEPPSHPKANVRLRQLHFFSTDIDVIKGLGNISLLIYSCFGLEIRNFSYDPLYMEVLVPVNEVFWVSNYDKDQKRMTLKTTNRNCSYYNCAYLGAGSFGEDVTEVKLNPPETEKKKCKVQIQHPIISVNYHEVS